MKKRCLFWPARWAAAALLTLLAAPQAGQGQPRFEVVSVRRAERCALEHSIDGSLVNLNGFPLTVVIMEAFKVKMDHIVGPSWLEQDCFSISAKIPEGAGKDQLPAMLEALLVERFKLVAHKENRVAPGYALVVDKGGSKMKQTAPDSPGLGQVRFGASSLAGSMGMGVLARYLSNRLGAPVEDQTGLKGTFEVAISWVPDAALEKPDPYFSSTGGGSPPAGASVTGESGIFTALRESLGLRLASRKEPVATIVIDHIERVPSEN